MAFFMMPMGGEPSPEEIAAAQEAHQKEVEREAMIARDLDRVFDTLDADGLYAVRRLLSVVTAIPARGVFYEGVLAGIMHVKHGRCLHCSLDHPDDVAHGIQALEDLVNTPKNDQEIDEKIFDAMTEQNIDGTGSLFDQLVEEEDPNREALDEALGKVLRLEFATGGAENPPEIIAAINLIAYARPSLPLSGLYLDATVEWAIDDLWETSDDPEAEPVFKGWVCKVCERGIWPSIQDRMLSPKGIDGCGACRLKSAHG